MLSWFCLCHLRKYLSGPYSLQVPTNTPAGVGIPWSTSEDQVSLNLLTLVTNPVYDKLGFKGLCLSVQESLNNVY